MATQILFLDIDGVLNSTTCAQRFKTFDTFGPENVAALNRILELTGADIVISSTWRYRYPKEHLQSILDTQEHVAQVMALLGNGTARLCPGCRSLDGEHDFSPTCTLTHPVTSDPPWSEKAIT
mgnify:CR=1 FL=1